MNRRNILQWSTAIFITPFTQLFSKEIIQNDERPIESKLVGVLPKQWVLAEISSIRPTVSGSKNSGPDSKDAEISFRHNVGRIVDSIDDFKMSDLKKYELAGLSCTLYARLFVDHNQQFDIVRDGITIKDACLKDFRIGDYLWLSRNRIGRRRSGWGSNARQMIDNLIEDYRDNGQ